MNRFILKRLINFFNKNLVIILVIYMFIFLLVISKGIISLGAGAMLFLPIILFSTIRWKLMGGLIFSSLLLSILSPIYLYNLKGNPTSLISGIFSTFITVIILGTAVTLRERRELQLRESERRYKDLYEKLKKNLDLIQVMVVALDAEGNVTYVNRKACEILGYKEEEIIGKDWFKSFLPKDTAKELKLVFKRIINGEIEPFEYHENPVIDKDGKEKIIVWHNTIIHNDTGGIVGTLSAGEDVTELRRLEKENQDRLRNLGILYDGARDLINEDLDIQKRAQIATRICVEDLGADLAWIGYKEASGKVSLIAQYPPDHSYTKDLTVRWDETPFGQGPVGRSIRIGIPQIIEDVVNDYRFEPWKYRALTYGFYTVGAFPLVSKNNVFGTLVLYSKQSGYFTLERKDIIYTLARLTASSLENARLFEDVQDKFRKIQYLHNIDNAISSSLDLKVILNTAVDEVIKQLHVDAVAIFLYNPSINTLEYAYGQGFRTNLIKNSTLRLGESLAESVALRRRMVKVLNLRDFIQNFTLKVYSEYVREGFENFVIEENFISYYAVPLLSKGELFGVLEVFNRSLIEENEEWENFLEILAKQIAIGIDNVRLFQGLQESNIRLINAYEETIEGWAYVLDLRDGVTEGHSRRVADLTVKIAKIMGIDDEKLTHIRRGALLHDIGKIAIPDNILLKPGKLTDEEWEIMKKHPTYAYQMLSKVEYLLPAIDIPLYHHEKWDGSGYPKGLKGEEIPLPARIFAVVDVYDALTSDRPYRKAWTKEEAIEYIKEQSGKKFDPKIVAVFLDIIKEINH